jgi:hypothetical protein
MKGFPTQACSSFGCLEILVHSERTQNKEKEKKKTRSLNVEKPNRTQNITKKTKTKKLQKNLTLVPSGFVSLASGDGVGEGRLERERERDLTAGEERTSGERCGRVEKDRPPAGEERQRRVRRGNEKNFPSIQRERAPMETDPPPNPPKK